MFTGIVLTMGRLDALERKESPTLTVRAQLPGKIKIGDSIAVNGACLTVVGIEADAYAFNLSAETLRLSHFADLSRGSDLNIELPVTMNDFLGGHLVSGHLDGVARVKAMVKKSGGSKISFVIGKREWEKFLVPKGSVCLNGVSLTISERRGSSFSVEVIPHTLGATNLQYLRVGERVNLELDLIGKYLYNFKSY
jgi:riboflavin synthase